MIGRTLALVPVYNHPDAIASVVSRLREHRADVLLVNDGSDDRTTEVLRRLASEEGVHVLELPENRGKGGAVVAGLEWARAHGHDSALQVDADGQHDVDDVPRLLEAARANPDSLISGLPEYDESVPRARLIGRYITHFWVWLETLSFSLRDSMCGFRVYPVDATLRVIEEENIGRRMDFDTEIMVRLFWRGCPTIFVPTRVHYPRDGVSHFRMLADNWRISRMHTRLMFGMIRRLPTLLFARNRRQPDSWASMGERGTLMGMRFLALMVRYLGRSRTEYLLWPIIGYFVIVHGRARRASRQYLARVSPYVRPALRDSTRPTLRNVFRHFLSFGREVLTKAEAWCGRGLPEISAVEDGVGLGDARQGDRGMLLIASHLGNVEVSRALASGMPGLDIRAVMYTEHARKFNRMMREMAPDFADRLILVEHMGADTAVQLGTLIDRGESVVIVGDRTPPVDNGRVVHAEFLGRAAPFAIGPYVLAHLLECRVGLLFCTRGNDGYCIDIEPFEGRVVLPRRQRDAELQRLAGQYARRLEFHATEHPLQWFNFYDFWHADYHLAGAGDGVRARA